jgi:AcrR family transcriptional regulator
MREEARVVSRKRLSRDERRARILEAAARVFADRGYDGATLDEIAEAAEISKPVIYDHFESKKDLHISLLDVHSRDLVEFMTERAISETDPGRQLAAGVDALLEFVERDPYAWRLIFREPAAADAEVLEAYKRNQGRASAAIAALTAAQPLPEHEDDPLDHDRRIEVVAEIIKHTGAALVAWWYEHRDAQRAELVTVAMNVLFVGLERMLDGDRWRT